jgi:hypothetical protein
MMLRRNGLSAGKVSLDYRRENGHDEQAGFWV